MTTPAEDPRRIAAMRIVTTPIAKPRPECAYVADPTEEDSHRKRCEVCGRYSRGCPTPPERMHTPCGTPSDAADRPATRLTMRVAGMPRETIVRRPPGPVEHMTNEEPNEKPSQFPADEPCGFRTNVRLTTVSLCGSCSREVEIGDCERFGRPCTAIGYRVVIDGRRVVTADCAHCADRRESPPEPLAERPAGA